MILSGLKKILWIKKVIEAVKRFLARIWLLLAVVLAAGSVAGSFRVPTKPFSVLLASAGCFASGWMFALALRKNLQLAEPDLEAQRRAERLTVENQGLQLEVDELRREKKRLEHQRIDLNAIRPILKLGLAEADMSIKDVKIAWLRDFSEPMFSAATRSQYVGVLEQSFKATYGVDLEKVRFQEASDCIRVAGIATESLGFKDNKTEWLVRQKQTYKLKKTSLTAGGPIPVANAATGFTLDDNYWEIDREKPFDGTLDLNATSDKQEQQQNDLQKRIDLGVGKEFQQINNYIQDMVKRFLELLLAPAGKPLVFVDTSVKEIEGKPEWPTLGDFVKEYNKRMELPEE